MSFVWFARSGGYRYEYCRASALTAVAHCAPDEASRDDEQCGKLDDAVDGGEEVEPAYVEVYGVVPSVMVSCRTRPDWESTLLSVTDACPEANDHPSAVTSPVAPSPNPH